MKILKISENFSFSSSKARKKLPRVGFFDSGLGGLTVLRDAILSGIEAEFYYYGDNQRAPYGNLPRNKIQEYARQAFDAFEKIGVDVAVIACNTVTAVCIETLRNAYPFPIVGTEPAVLPAVRAFSDVSVLATEATCQSDRLNKLCAHAREKYPAARVSVIACPLLAGAIERGILGGETIDYAAYLPKIEKIGDCAAIVLGCTHYLFLRRYIAKFYNLPVFDGNDGVVRQLKKILKNPPLNSEKRKKTTIVTTERPPTTTMGEEDLKSLIFQKKLQKYAENTSFFPVFFLGSGQENNKKVCEQMFVY